VFADLGDHRCAIEYYQQWLEITLQLGDRRRQSFALRNIGLAELTLGNVRTAIDYFERAVTIAREIGERENDGMALCNLGLAYWSLGDYDKAVSTSGRRSLSRNRLVICAVVQQLSAIWVGTARGRAIRRRDKIISEGDLYRPYNQRSTDRSYGANEYRIAYIICRITGAQLNYWKRH